MGYKFNANYDWGRWTKSIEKIVEEKEPVWDSYVPDKPIILFDLEGDGLDPTKIHCVCYSVYDYDKPADVKEITDYKEMKKFFSQDVIFAGHNIILWDIPAAIEKILDIKIKGRVIDTLWLSRYLCPNRSDHKLDSWGYDLGIAKPIIDDWEKQDIEDYLHRCTEDVKINIRLMKYLFIKFKHIYGEKMEPIWRFVWYLMYKAECIQYQERSKWKLDRDRCILTLEALERDREEKMAILKECMPLAKKYATKSKPKIMEKKDGTLSALGLGWLTFLEAEQLPADTEGPVKYIKEYIEPNPNSTEQIKDWLYSLGWKPTSFNYVPTNDGNTRKIPQIRVEVNDEKVLCESVRRLLDREPNLEVLQTISTLSHRIGTFKGFLRDVDKNGFLTATAAGLTNTLRLRHKVLVNLPGVGRPYGKDVRGCLIAPEGYELCGSDLKSLENRTRDHFIYPFDPEYVETMMEDDYDPHIAIATTAGLMTKEEAEEYKRLDKKKGDHDMHPDENPGLTDEEKREYKRLKGVRHKGKTVVYSAVYGVGAKKLAITLDITRAEAKKLLDAYWEINWSVKHFAQSCKVKTLKNKEMWVFNPLSKFWYSLRFEKDIFSTVNQSAGVFIFDTWIKLFRKRRKQLTGQFHDEVVLTIRKGNREACDKLLRGAMAELNERLPLRREMDCDVQFGDNYSQIH